MLGCHEFCGYYEWTFHFVRQRWGQAAVERLWAEAIGGESQQYYAQAAREAGLAGLYRTWVKTGRDESCDWTFTLDQQRNVLRWDMRNCPSKGFLLAHGMNADEDYCNHCMGWMIPLLGEVGVEVSEHEHNHQGQCWGAVRMADRPAEPLSVDVDIRQDPRWNFGYVERWEHNRQQPVAPCISAACDPCQVLKEWFAPVDHLLVIICTQSAAISWRDASQSRAGLIEASVYACHGDLGLRPAAVLIGHEGHDLPALAKRWKAAPADRRPLLVHPYLPACQSLDFSACGLPRPLPLLPLLIRTGQYVHRPGTVGPSPEALLLALARALAKPFVVVLEQSL